MVATFQGLHFLFSAHEQMNANYRDVLAILAAQCEHQVRFNRRQMPRWIPWIFVLGLCVSLFGLIPFIAAFRESGSITVGLVGFGLAALFFGWVVISWLLWPYRLRPRIVPYFVRELGRFGGDTMAAFTRGRGLYREIAALEKLAESLGVKSLSAFGFAYDHYGQHVSWHPASEGLRTVEALRDSFNAQTHAAPDVAQDLQALASVLRTAATQGVDFSLVLRLHAKDSMQGVCTREARQGSFW
jgi:hypothetical protein